MLGLPDSTEIKKQLPKTLLTKKFGLKPEYRRLIDENVSRLDLINQISPKTIPALAEGGKVKSIFLLQVTLKKRNYASKAITLIAKVIPQNLILLLSYDGESQLAVFHEKLLTSSWRQNKSWNDDASIMIYGADLDRVWLSLKSQISGILLPEGKELTEQVFLEELHTKEERDRLKKKIAQLQRARKTEVQPRRKFELHNEIQQLKKQLSRGNQNDQTGKIGSDHMQYR